METEICVDYKECTAVPADINASEIIFPFEYLVNQHTVQWRTIIKSKQETETIICPPGEICSKICASFVQISLEVLTVRYSYPWGLWQPVYHS